jgi:hypothetical protein
VTSMCTANGTSCATGASCCSGICIQGLCAATGTTCGQTGAGCNGNAGCCSGFCGGLGVCIVPQPTCTDGVKDANETDTDCGGSVCATCASGKACLANFDCQSKMCTMGVCQ